MQPVPPTSAASPKRHRRCRMSIATGDTRGSHPSNHETRRDGRQERRRTQIDPVLLVSPAGGGGRRRRPGVALNPAISGEGCIGCPTPSGAGPRSYSPPLKPRVPSGTKENGIPVACELSPKGRKRIAHHFSGGNLRIPPTTSPVGTKENSATKIQNRRARRIPRAFNGERPVIHPHGRQAADGCPSRRIRLPASRRARQRGWFVRAPSTRGRRCRGPRRPGWN